MHWHIYRHTQHIKYIIAERHTHRAPNKTQGPEGGAGGKDMHEYAWSARRVLGCVALRTEDGEAQAHRGGATTRKGAKEGAHHRVANLYA